MILRRIGVALLGLIGGILAGVLVQDLLAGLLMDRQVARPSRQTCRN